MRPEPYPSDPRMRSTRLAEALIGHGQRDAEEALAVGPVGGAWADDHPGLLQHLLSKRCGRVALRHGRPYVDSPLRRLEVDPDLAQRADHEVAPARVDRAHLPHGVLGPGERLRARELDGLEQPGVHVRLQLPVRRDGLGIPGDRGAPPAGHVPPLGEREHLHADVHGSRSRQKARRHVAVVGELRVRRVMHDQEAVLPCELDDAIEEAVRHDRTGRIVRVVHEHQPGALERGVRDRGQIRHEAQLGHQRHQHRLQRRRSGARRCRADSRDRPPARRRPRRGTRS